MGARRARTTSVKNRLGEWNSHAIRRRRRIKVGTVDSTVSVSTLYSALIEIATLPAEDTEAKEAKDARRAAKVAKRAEKQAKMAARGGGGGRGKGKGKRAVAAAAGAPSGAPGAAPTSKRAQQITTNRSA
eukprot:166382-Prorocentrum_minimum.AAC.2